MSNNYSFIERGIAAFLRKFPGIKKTIKTKYQKLNYVLYKKKEKVISLWNVSKIERNPEEESFFGYYDKSPMNRRENVVLFHSTNYSTKNLPTDKEEIFVVAKNVDDNKIIFEENVTAYNWQQGCRLQWINDDSFIFNTYSVSNKIYVSKIVNTSTQHVKEINFPIYDSYNDFGISLNFDRLDDLRPDYGYRNKDKRFKNYTDENDGIFYVDFSENTYSLLITLKELKNLKPLKTMEAANHKVNHIMISPNGKKVMFLHRWFTNQVKYDRLVVMNVDGSDLTIVLDDEMVSHCYWLNDNEIIGYARKEGEGDCYLHMNLITKEKTSKELRDIANFGDGHPNINGDKILFDTYPDRSRMKNLYIYNFKTRKLEKVAAFFESFKFGGETRCDLHPRWNFSGDKIFVDSVHENEKRKLYLLKK